jgi:ABC-type branched-subunit amino acid transport system ATPase component
MGSKYGALLGAWFYVYVEDGLRDADERLEFLRHGPFERVFTFSEKLDQYWPIVYGGLLVLVMIALPDGLIGVGSRLAARRRRPAVTDAAFAPVPARPPLADAGAGPVVRASGIRVSFGGVQAVDGVDLEVGAGEILGLIGPNGSGKSTLLNAITGVVPAEGALEVGGRPVLLGRPQRSRRAGLARTYQTPQTFTALTCLENVLLGVPGRQRTGVAASVLARPLVVADERARWDEAQAALVEVGLPGHAERPAAGLPYRDQRLLELARALVGRPRALLLDEPSAGLNAAETDELCALLAGLRDGGMSLLVVDHKIDFITTLCDRVVVLELGRLIAEGDPHEIWDDQRVVDVYLGVPVEAAEEVG